MEKPPPDFRMPDYEPEARLARLPAAQLEGLEKALAHLSASGQITRRTGSDQDGLPIFLLPLAEFGLSSEHMIHLAEAVPADFPLDHRNIYFDFRLNRWMRHIEPPTILESLDEYFENAESPEQGLDYLTGQWQAFLRRHGKG